jgi:nucleolar protein 15
MGKVKITKTKSSETGVEKKVMIKSRKEKRKKEVLVEKVELVADAEVREKNVKILMKEADVADLKVKANKVELEEEKRMNDEETTLEPEKVSVKRKESLMKSNKKTGAKTFISLANPEEDNKSIKGEKPLNRWKSSQNAVIFLRNIPHGFYEKEMQSFFEQFGAVTNLRLGRSKSTGRSRGYAFIEFQYSEVAKVVAESMNNYLMFNEIMKCEVVPKEKCSPKMFSGKINPNMPPRKIRRRKSKKIMNMDKTDEANLERKSKQLQKLQNMEQKLAQIGVDFKIKLS